ncbi:tail assembly chaperone [Arthrobacter phage Ottawa]|nr:tail assembly chaperone [Arthrobacter phage Kharcho]WIC89273.1 tail assembly chaperone [Arthrobacter phage Ottawa]
MSTVTEQFIEGATADSYAADGSKTAEFSPVGAEPIAAETEGYKAPGGGLRESIRDRIAKRRPYASREVFVPAWEETIEVRSISLGLRNEMLTSVMDEETKEADIKKLYPELIIRTSYDPQTGERVFSNDDLAFINGLDAGSADLLAKPALELSGMTDDAKDKEAGKSSETETSV